jgi:thioester reductase-like protein
MSGIKTTVFRPGQIAGQLTAKGSWNKQKWLPSVIASSRHFRVLPESLASFEVIDWIPVDMLSDIMVELIDNIL